MAELTTIGFIGAGRMATAMAQGLLQNALSPQRLFACDPAEDARVAFGKLGGNVYDNAQDVIKNADVIVLAVKPQYMDDVLRNAQPHITARHLVVSIAAGIPIRKLSAGLGDDRRIIRVMPNTPCLQQEGASAFAAGPNAHSDDIELVSQIMNSVGITVQVPEAQLDAVTGLSGSGPAYVYQFIEALSDGGVLAGLPRDLSTKLAAQTVLGAATMVLAGDHPAVCKDAVASPGGTTIAGLHELEKGGLRGLVMNAVKAATERSKQLGE
jgi:pyrroline-5-carboxylate reductase